MNTAYPLFDVHCHLTHEQYPVDLRPSIAREAFQDGVKKIAVVALNHGQLVDALALQEQFGEERLKVVASTPPHDIIGTEDPFFEDIWALAQQKKLSAIGETGLEYFYSSDTKIYQKQALHRYIECALTFDLPLVIHCRDAFGDMIPIIEKYKEEKKPLRGMIHCFTGTMEEAEKLLELGWYLSISGIVTFPKALALQEVVKRIPLDRLLLETDSPYLAPKQKRGKENRPSYLVYVAEFIASLREVPYERIAQATFENAETFFGSSHAK